MMEILAIQMIAALLGICSIATADWLYQRERIHRRLHSLWISVSSTAICLPILSWIIVIFLGKGIVGWGLAAVALASMFFWQYQKLLKIPPTHRIRRGPVPVLSSGRSVRPPSNINR
jgi:H+/Cl- antiporter ClcA